jgi:LPXTG-motif cell wall-anchored protein
MFDYWWQWVGLIVLIGLIVLFFVLRKKGQNK